MSLGISQLIEQIQFSVPPAIMFLFLLMFSVVAIILAVVSLAVVSSLKKALAATAAVKEKEPEQPGVVEKPREEAVEERMPESSGVGERKIPEVKVRPNSVAALRELASNLNLNAILFFNLAGLPIESYNIRDASNIAASLAEFIHTLRRFGFPDDVIRVSNGVNVYILLVKRIEDLEIYALVVGSTELEMGDLKSVLNQLLTTMLGENT